MDKHYQELYNMNLTTGSGTRYTDLRNGSTFWRTNRADLAKDNAWKLHFPTWENISTFDGTSWWLITPADGMVGWEKSFAFFDKKNELWDVFWRLAKSGFSSKRKKLISNLYRGISLPKALITQAFKKAGIEENVRAEDLRVDDWLILADFFRKNSIKK